MTQPREPTLPFSQIPQWPMLAPISAGAKVLYVLLVMHVNREDASNRTAWPSRASLARLAGYARPQTMDPYIEELEKLGAVVVDRGRHPSQPLRKRNTYRVVLAGDPAPAGVGDLSLTDYYKRISREGAGQPGGAVQRTSGGVGSSRRVGRTLPGTPGSAPQRTSRSTPQRISRGAPDRTGTR